jgi:hypothetical protein
MGIHRVEPFVDIRTFLSILSRIALMAAQDFRLILEGTVFDGDSRVAAIEHWNGKKEEDNSAVPRENICGQEHSTVQPLNLTASS